MFELGVVELGVAELGVAELEEASEEKGEVGVGKGFEAGDAFFAFFRFPTGVEDGGAETELFESFGEERHRFVRGVVMGAHYDDDVLFLAFGTRSSGREDEESEGREKGFQQ